MHACKGHTHARDIFEARGGTASTSAAACATAEPACSYDSLAAVVHGAQDLRIEHRPVRAPQVGEAVVQVVVQGICGTDVTAYMRGAVGGRAIKRPMTLGHECAGTLHALPPGVDEVPQPDGRPAARVGDRVAVKPGFPCMTCRQCVAGHTNRCEAERYFAKPPTEGSMAQFICVAQDALVRLPEGTTWSTAGCMQPLAIGVQVARRAQLRPCQTVAIFGLGPVGQIATAMAKAYCAKKIIAIDTDPERVKWTRNKPVHTRPDHVFLSPWTKERWAQLDATASSAEKLAACQEQAQVWLREAGMTHGVDVVIEASAAEAASIQGMEMLDFGGTYTHVGISASPLTAICWYRVTGRELTIRGVLRYDRGCFEDALTLLEAGKISVDDLVTDHYLLHEAADAFQAVAKHKGIKTLVWMSDIRTD